MRTKSGTEFGFFAPRVCVAMLLCVGGVSLAVFGLAVSAPLGRTTYSPRLITSTTQMSGVTVKEFADF
jgi:hypothetical protein